jgi:sulfatase maturation enzyme AslB (radical SAM superfamily)
MVTPLSYWQRHLRNFIRYGTIRKYLNLTQAYAAYLFGSVKIASMPAFLRVEICRYCEVNCLYCYPAKAQLLYPLEDYKQLIDQFKNFIFSVSLYDIGEPLHHPQVLEYIRYAHQNKIGTVISSSLSFERDDDYWNSLATSGLDYMIVAIDGITREVYNHYRRNGQLDLVMSNLKKLLAFRNSADAKLFIEWQMIDFDWNRCEQSQAREMAYQLGCDRFEIIAEATQPRKCYDEERTIRNRSCLLPYILFFVTANNRVRLCYKIYHHDMCIGSLSDHTFTEIWNGSEIGRVRDRKQIGDREGCQKCRE